MMHKLFKGTIPCRTGDTAGATKQRRGILMQITDDG